MIQNYFDKSKAIMLEKLEKTDKSRKGEIDKDAKPIIKIINSTKNFYTTSSCSGRISLFRESHTKKKFDSGWLIVKHAEITKEEINNALKKIPLDTVWFRQETPIFHIACRTINDAKELLTVCKNLGFKHSGIIGIGKRTIIEIIFNEKIDCPISENEKLLISKDHLDLLINKANEKLRINNQLLKKFEVELKKIEK